MGMQNSTDFIYNPPHLNYTEEQAIFLGLSEDRFDIDKDMPNCGFLAGGIMSVMLAKWLKGFNPVENAPVLDEEKSFNYPSIFKPIQELNRRKLASKAAYLKYVENLNAAGDLMFSFSSSGKLTENGIKEKSREVIASFIDASFRGVLMVEFKENATVIDRAIKTLRLPPEGPETPEDTLIDTEIRTVYRGSEDLRLAALNGDISPRHDLALARSEASISGFSKKDFDVLFFSAAVRKKIKEAHQVDMLYAINCALWLMACRTITGLADFAKFLPRDKELTLHSLGLEWHGSNLMSGLDSAKLFLETAVKQESNRNLAVRIEDFKKDGMKKLAKT